VAQKTADSLATVGVSLDKCSVPQRAAQESLPSDELEYGMGESSKLISDTPSIFSPLD
jgi:triose/dihydroxyacetone kinase / FAD-AMP lyase (cyclizing)